MPKHFLVNSIGEAFYGHKCLISGVNICDVARKTFTPGEYKRWEKALAQKGKLYDRLKVAVAQEFQDIAKANMTANQFKLYNQITHLQQLNDAQCRIYGGITAKGERYIKLVAEFQAFVDHKHPWQMLRQVAKDAKATIRQMHKGPHIDKYHPAKGVPGEVQTKEPLSTDPNAFWVTGPNHGRMEKQVELYWNIETTALSQVKGLLAAFRGHITNVFENYGVNVL